MKTVIQEMYDDAMANREQRLQFYLNIEKIQMKTFALELGVTPELVDKHYAEKYENQGPQTTTVRPDIPE